MVQTPAIDLEVLLSDRRARRFQIRLLILLAIFMFFEGYDMQVLSFAAPAIIKSWHSSKAAFGGVFGGAMAGFMVGAMIIGNLGDYFGRAKMIVGGSIIFGAFTLLSGFAHNLPELFVWRTLAGIGLGGAVPNAIVLVSEYWPSTARTTSVTLMYVGYTVGSALGGLAAAYLIPNYGWPSVFIVGGVAPIVIAIFLWIMLPESLRFLILKGKKPDSVLKIVNQLRPGENFTSPPQILIEEKNEKGVPVRQLFTSGRALMTCMLWLACICNTITLHFMTSWLPTVVASEGVPLSHAIIISSVLQVSGALGGLVGGRLIDTRGVTAIAGFIGCAIPMLILLSHFSGVEALTIVFVAGSGFTIIGSFAILLALSGVLYPSRMRSTGAGWTYGIARLGAIFGPMIGGVLLTLDLTPKALFQFAVVPIAFEFVAIVILARQPSAQDLSASKKVETKARLSRSSF